MLRIGLLGLVLAVMGCGFETPQPGSQAHAGEADTVPVGEGKVPASLWTRNRGTDWPGFLGPLGTSVSPEKGIITPWPARGLRMVWHKRTGIGYGMPSISRGRLFQFDRVGDRARLLCLNAENGEFLWKFEYPTKYVDQFGYDGGPRCCPVVDDDRVYILGAEGMLHCLRVADGKLHWKVDTASDYGVIQNFFGVGSAPVIEKDLLILQVGGSPAGSQGEAFDELKGNGTGIIAFDKRSGEVKYKITDELASYSGPVLATLGERRWCFVFARGGLVGFDPGVGKVDFHFPYRSDKLESVNASNPVVVGNRVFISETYGRGGALLEVKPGQAPRVIWNDDDKRLNDKSMECHWMTPIHHEGYLYGCSGRHMSAELRCIELATGKVMWSEPDLTRTSLLMVDGHFICLGENGVVRLLKVNPKKYEEVSRLIVRDPTQSAEDAPSLLRYPCWAAPILSHGLLFLRGDGHLVCLELIPDSKEPSGRN